VRERRVAEYLDIACAAERFIDGRRRPTDNGVLWSHSRERPELTSHSLYNGSSGIVLFYLELHAATGEKRHRDSAIAAADELIAYVHATKRQSCAIYTGWPGLAFALADTARITGLARFADAAVYSLDRLRGSAQEFGSAVRLGWIEPMPFSDIHGFKGDREIYDASVGAAGAGFVFLYAARTQLHPKALQWAIAVGDRLLDVAIQTADGLNWALMSEMPFPCRRLHGDVVRSKW
jgi:lantibiotic modifying enzyme